MNLHIMKIIYAIAGFLVLAVIFLAFISGNKIHSRLQGRWVEVDTQETITFSGDNYSRGKDKGRFEVRGNRLYLDPVHEYYIFSINENYLEIDGIFYIKSDP